MSRAARIALIALCLAGAGPATASAAVSLAAIGSFSSPIFVTAPPGDTHRVFVVEQGGTIRIVQDGTRLATPFLDLTAAPNLVISGGEQGLLSMAFAPDYATSGLFYVYYTRAGDKAIQIDEFHVSAANPNVADRSTRRAVLTIAHSDADNHNGGQLQFGPDGMLWLATGDGGGAGGQYGHSRDRNSLLAKLLRIDPHAGNGCGGGCTIPAGNPFAGGGGAPEVWAVGLRNPWRFSFDRQTGDLVIADVGQGRQEEVDFAPASAGRLPGADYGWNLYEGNLSYPSGDPAGPPFPSGFQFPVLTYDHGSTSQVSIAGGYVVRDPALPELVGQYVYADTYAGHIRAVTLGAGSATGDHDTGFSTSLVSSFGEDGCARVYVASLASGPSPNVFRLSSTGDCTPPAAAGGPDGGGPGGGTSADKRPPALSARAPSKQHVLKTGRIIAWVRCDEQCALNLSATIVIGRAHAARLDVPKLRRTLAANSRIRMELLVPQRIRARVAKALRRHHRAHATLHLRATDFAGNARSATRLVRIVRR